MRTCPQCGKQYTLNERLCPHDGSTLENLRPVEEQNLGRVLAGKYRIDGFIKRGGMGAVYRATHVMLDKPVAIKLIKPELVTSEDTVRRFQREARAASQLSHPNIVAVYDLGQTDDGTLYIAMELVSGESLKDVVKKQGSMEPYRATRIVKAIASALALAHKNNIVHRDLKPQNIMMTQDNEGRETPKLLDFGIAKTFEPDSPALTSTGMVLGTPQYMSPEQAAGKTVDARSDLYSLGIILYEMLVGKVPFDDASIPAILIKHLNEIPRRPSELCEGLPTSLEHIVLRCLEKDPQKRFSGTEELLTAISTVDLTVAIAEEGPTAGIPALTQAPPKAQTELTSPPLPPTVVRHPSRPEPISQPTVREPRRTRAQKKNLVPILALATVLLVMLGGVVVFLLSRAEEPAEKSEATTSEASVGTLPGPSDEPPTPSPVQPTPTGTDDPPPTASPEKVVAADEIEKTVVYPKKPTKRPREAVKRPQRPAGSAQSPRTPVAPPPTPPPPVSESDPLPGEPSVNVKCKGLSDACGSVVSALERSFANNAISLVRGDRAEISIDVLTEEIETRTEEQFGTLFVVRTYSIELSGSAWRFDEIVSMPPPETFSFDTRFGREKLSERTRVLADAITDKILAYWNAKKQ